MPNINLRLTDEQHAALERWAKDGHRSLQKEIIWRLFVDPAFRRTNTVISDAQPRDVPTRTIVPDREAKPDFGKKLK
jgi:hypothetical protein